MASKIAISLKHIRDSIKREYPQSEYDSIIASIDIRDLVEYLKEGYKVCAVCLYAIKTKDIYICPICYKRYKYSNRQTGHKVSDFTYPSKMEIIDSIAFGKNRK